MTCLSFFFSLYAFGTVPRLSSFVIKPMEIPCEPCERPGEISFQNLWTSTGTPLKYRVEFLSKPVDIPIGILVKYLSEIMDILRDPCKILCVILCKANTVIPFPSYQFLQSCSKPIL